MGQQVINTYSSRGWAVAGGTQTFWYFFRQIVLLYLLYRFIQWLLGLVATKTAKTVDNSMQDNRTYTDVRERVRNVFEDRTIVPPERAQSNPTPMQTPAIRFGSTEFIFRRRGDPSQIALAENWTLAGDEVSLPLPRQAQVRIGSSPSCDVVLADPSVQIHHCTLKFSDQGIRLQSIAGPYVTINDQPVLDDTSMVLQKGDLVTVGSVELALISA